MRDIDFHCVKWSKEILQGKPYQEILKTIKKRKGDLLVMGTSGRTGLSLILMGSVTEKVTREVPSSLITTKTEGVIRLRLETEIRDLWTHFKDGNQLLKKGFANEALNQFQLYLNIDHLYSPDWEAIITPSIKDL